MEQSHDSFRRALITGGYSGIGAAFARRLARDGTDLILVARDGEALEAFAQELRNQFGVAIDVTPADLVSDDGLKHISDLIGRDTDLDLLINNAAFGAYKPLTELSPDLAETQIRLQVLAVVRLSLAALPGMVARRNGTIINVSSTSFFWVPQIGKRGIYPATKAFETTFTELLSMDLAGTGVRVQALIPGLASTPFHQRARRDISQMPPNWFMDPDRVVDGSLAGLRLGEVLCVPGLNDAELLEQYNDLRRRLFETTLTDELAERYQN